MGDDLQFAFLGVCERVSQTDSDGTPWRHNIIGLKQVVHSHIFPLNLSEFKIALGVYTTGEPNETTIAFVNEAGEDVFTSRISGVKDPDNRNPGHSFYSLVEGPAWHVLFLSSDDVRPIITEPGIVRVEARSSRGNVQLGALAFEYVPYGALTQERIAATGERSLV